MSLLKIINGRKNPLDVISQNGSDRCEHSETVVRFSIVSNNASESVNVSSRVGGDRGSTGSFSLKLEGGSEIIQRSLSYDDGEVLNTVSIPTNTALELRITSETPTSKIEGGRERLLSTSCSQSSRYSNQLVSSLRVSLQNSSLNLSGLFSANSHVWVDDNDDGGGLGGGLIP